MEIHFHEPGIFKNEPSQFNLEERKLSPSNLLRLSRQLYKQGIPYKKWSKPDKSEPLPNTLSNGSFRKNCSVDDSAVPGATSQQKHPGLPTTDLRFN